VWRRVLAYVFAFFLLIALTVGGVLTRPHLVIGLWIACAAAALAISALLINLVWQWADQDPYR